MTRLHWLMAAALVVAAGLALFGDKTADTGIAEPVTRAPVPMLAGSATPRPVAPVVGAILVLQPRQALIGGAGSGKPDALFGSQSWMPPPPPPVVVKPLPAPPPQAPPLPFTYLGKKMEDGRWEVFLARGEQTFIVHEQSVIDGVYRIEAITPPQMSITYLPLRHIQTLTIGGMN
ncbi:hypothetical protein [Actimicrobium antarcticum]|uniref:Prolin-rich transmembrane protein n=1 Tax=Actimicrobium antarcticum TaxID=1051899 RepID=A0ABP7TSV5_9BURK